MATQNRSRSFFKSKSKSKGTGVQTRPDALRSSPLRKLPAKIILRIAEFISPASQLPFYLSCRRVYSITQPQHRCSVLVRPNRQPPWEVLELGCPDDLECYYCRELHPMNKIHEYTHSKEKRGLCWKMDQRVRTEIYIHPEFSFTVFRMVMKQYRQGKDCKEVLQLLAYRSKIIIEDAQVKQVTVTPRIVGERLLIRSQTAYIVPPTNKSRLYLLNRNLMKCPHTTRFHRRNRALARLLRRKFIGLKGVVSGGQEHIFSCRCVFCPTEFHFHLERVEGQGAILLITKWQDLGTGLSPYEYSPVVGPRLKFPIDSLTTDVITYESPRTRFEGPGLDQNLNAVSALTSQERTDMFRESDSAWVRMMRTYDRYHWAIVGYGQMHPAKLLTWDEIWMYERIRRRMHIQNQATCK